MTPDLHCPASHGVNTGRTPADRLNQAHRLMFELHRGPIPTGLQIDHLCRQPLCVNPDHLEPVTSAENTRRGKALITHCPAGHPYDDANTYLAERPTGSARHCRTCLAIRKRARYVPHPRDIVHNVRRYYKYGCRCATCCADRDRYVLELRATRAAS